MLLSSVNLEFRKSWQALAMTALVFAFGCAKSPKGSIEELVKTRPPTLLGASDRNYTTPSIPFVLNGECDPVSYDIEWSYDMITWTVIPGGCPASVFTLNFTVPGYRNVYVRAKTKTGYTSSAHAYVRFLPPPTSHSYSFVSSGHAGEGMLSAPTTQNGIEHNFTCDTLTGVGLKMKMSLIDTLYE